MIEVDVVWLIVTLVVMLLVGFFGGMFFISRDLNRRIDYILKNWPLDDKKPPLDDDD